MTVSKKLFSNFTPKQLQNMYFVVRSNVQKARSNVQNTREQFTDKASEVVLGPEHKEVVSTAKSIAKGAALFSVVYPTLQETVSKGVKKGHDKINNLKHVNNEVPSESNKLETLYNNNALGFFKKTVQVIEEEFNSQMNKEHQKVQSVRELNDTLIKEEGVQLTIKEGLQHIENPSNNALVVTKSLHSMSNLLSDLSYHNNKNAMMAFEDFHNEVPIVSSKVTAPRLPDTLDTYKVLAAFSETKVSEIGKKMFVEHGSNVIGFSIEKMYKYLNSEQKKEYANAFKEAVENTKTRDNAEKTREEIIKNKKLELKLKAMQKETMKFIVNDDNVGSKPINVKTNTNKKDLGM